MYYVLFLLLTFTMLGFSIYRTLLNPITVFNGVWFTAIGLYSLGLTPFPSDLSNRGIQAFILMTLCFNCAFFYLTTLKLLVTRKKAISKPKEYKSLSKKGIILLFFIWLTLTIFEVFYSGGFPMLWILTGSTKNYAQFGIPTLHGFINSLAWVIVMCAFCYYLDAEKTDRTMLKIIFLILGVSVLLLARQTIVTGFVQVFIIYLLKRKINISKILFTLGTAIVLFGIAGNFRSGAEHFKMIARIDTNIPEYLLGIYWVYMYIVTPVGNMDNIVNFNLNFMNGLVSVRTFLPTALNEVIFGSTRYVNPDFLVTKSFNVSSFLQIPYQDFGLIGIALISSVYGFIGFYFWNYYHQNKNSAESIMLYAICLQIIIMSFFVNMFLMIPIIIQFLYIKVFLKFDVLTK